jgi:hypothetical protein
MSNSIKPMSDGTYVEDFSLFHFQETTYYVHKNAIQITLPILCLHVNAIISKNWV